RMNSDAGVVDEVVEALAAPLGGERLLEVHGEGGKAGRLSGIELEHHRLASEPLDSSSGGSCLGLVAVIGADDVDARARERDRGVAAKAAAGAGDDGNLGVGVRHGLSPCR